MARHFATLDDHPAVAEWYERITERPEFQKSLPEKDGARLYAQDFYPAWETAG